MYRGYDSACFVHALPQINSISFINLLQSLLVIIRFLQSARSASVALLVSFGARREGLVSLLL